MEIRSALGQPLRASVRLLGDLPESDETHCVHVRLTALDGTALPAPKVGIVRNGPSASLQIGTIRGVNEPVLNLLVRLECSNPMQRTFQVLLDPANDAAAPVAVQPVAAVATAKDGTLLAKPDAAPRTAEAIPATQARHAPSRATGRAGRQPLQATRKPRHRAHPVPSKAIASPHSTLRLFADDAPHPVDDAALNLRLANRLVAPPEDSYLKRREDIRAEQARLAAAETPDEVARSASALIRKLQAELESLRIETERLKQQSRAEKAAMVAARDNSVNWIIAVGSLIAICLGAIAWLLWRFVMMQKAAPQIPWNEFDTLRASDSIDALRPSEFRDTTLSAFETTASTVTQGERTLSIDSLATTQAAIDAAPDDAGTKVTAPAPASGTPTLPGSVPAASFYRHTGLAPYIATNATEAVRRPPDPSLKAEEISDVMELVEAWMALNDPPRVLELLKPFGEMEQPQSPLPWICLLDVYRAMGDREKYEATQEKIRNIFNVKLTSWDTAADEGPAKCLADYPHITERITAIWDSDEIGPYLETLVRDNRDGERDGFDLPVYRDLLKLIALINEPGCRRNDQVMDPRAYAILFSPRPARAPAPVLRPHAATSVDGNARNPTSAAIVNLRERPRYITPSYERAIRGGQPAQDTTLPQAGTNRGDAPEKDAASSGPESVPAAKPDMAASVADTTTAQGVAAVASASAIPATTVVRPAQLGEVRDDLSPIAVKLQLAAAYQELGDLEGAMILLEEVVESGDAEHAHEAREMLGKMPPLSSVQTAAL